MTLLDFSLTGSIILLKPKAFPYDPVMLALVLGIVIGALRGWAYRDKQRKKGNL